MPTREIGAHLQEIYGADVSAGLISNVTEAVMEEVKIWQGRSLDEVYPILYMDALRVKIRDGGHVINKAICVAVGVKDIFVACVDGLKGLPDATETMLPNAEVQLCIVHMVRASLGDVNWKQRKEVAGDLKKIYQSATEE
jgi:putative transposase